MQQSLKRDAVELVSFDATLDGLSPLSSDTFEFRTERNWMQGRALFGGVAAAMALRASKRSVENLPPLRTASFSFISPISEAATIKVTPLRAGKSATFVSAEIYTADQVAMRADFVFAPERVSVLPTTLPQRSVDFSTEPFDDLFLEGKRPRLAQNFDIKLVEGDRPITASQRSKYAIRACFIEQSNHPEEAALALSDLAPPAVLQMFPSPAPISTMNWTYQSLTEIPRTEIGQVDIEIVAESIVSGVSYQTSTLWTPNGVPVARNVQTIAGFI